MPGLSGGRVSFASASSLTLGSSWRCWGERAPFEASHCWGSPGAEREAQVRPHLKCPSQVAKPRPLKTPHLEGLAAALPGGESIGRCPGGDASPSAPPLAALTHSAMNKKGPVPGPGMHAGQLAMRPLILLSLLSGGLVLTSKIQNECAKGAAYWCSNLMTAIQCGALDYCVQTGWNQASNENVWNRKSNEDMCADCKQLLSILMRMAKESAFKKTLQKYLEEECTNLPLQTLIPQCQALVKDYYARFIASLEKKLDPSIMCTQLGACPADLLGSQGGLMQLLQGLERLLPQLQGQVSTLPSGHTQEAPGEQLLPIPLPLCWLCRTFIGKAESIIPKAAIGKAMSKLCLVLPGAVAGMCQCLMEKYTVIIVDTLVSKLGPRLICGMMLMCASEENCGPESLVPSAAEGCRMCLLISGQVAAPLRANRTRGAVEAALSSACSPSFSSWPQCNHFIHQHQAKLSALLMKPWDPQTLCQELGACAAEKLLLRATPCAQGPTYWCSSLSAAKQCEAIQHCQDHVWL